MIPPMTPTIRHLTILLTVLAVIAACGSDADNPLADTDWVLIELGDAGNPDAAFGGYTVDMQFSENEVGGWTGCNAFGGEYTVRGDELRLADLGWTEAGCPTDPLFRQEQRIQDSLIAIERFEASGNRLTLHSEGGQVLIFVIAGTRLE